MYLGCIRAKELAEKSGEAIPDLRESFPPESHMPYLVLL